ncbi:folliculin-interacting protein 1-like isoform X2 [Tubulanus polymorphus]|uniref:folliculin-interacting protein 1-like isoform X2 n=1 Tax=Tubulanus polymorphus TaxID=672921 RepID=UPI003DA3064C
MRKLPDLFDGFLVNWRGSVGRNGKHRWIVPEFKKTQIRLLVFKDHDVRGKTLLFDSKSIKLIDEKQEEENKQTGARRSLLRTYSPRKPSGLIDSKESITSDSEQPNNTSPKTSRYQFQRPGSDVKMLGEMMFGCIPMSYRGTSLKVHYIRYPPQLVFTKVFVPSKTARGSSGEVDLYDSCSLQSLSCSDCSSARQITCTQRNNVDIARSVPVDMPKPYRSHNDTDDSGLSGSLASSGSFTPFPSPGNSSINSNSYNSLHRRWIRSQQTCLEFGVRQRTDDGCHQTPEPMPASQRKQKIGIGVVFDLFGEREEEKNTKFQQFFFSHITLFEGHVEKLKCQIERAMSNKREFVHIVMEGLDRFRTEVFDLYTAARLPDPVWLGMMSISDNRQTICQHFVNDFINVIQKCDTKSTNFFISTLITTVLTYHLAWVPTVTPAGAIPSRTYLDKHSAKWLDALAKSHPYNPLWAQLSDLYGAIGYPLKLARTVVVGKKQELVNKVLRILSYFIRCSEVFECTKNDIFLDADDATDRGADQIGYRGEMSLIEEESNSENSNQTTPVKTLGLNKDLQRVTEVSSPAGSVPLSKTPDSQVADVNDGSVVRCRLSTVDFVEPKIENIVHVRRSAGDRSDDVVETETAAPPVAAKKATYVRLPSKESSIVNAMEDCFDGECEAKTIDDISYEDRVTQYLAECEQFKGSMDIPDDDPEISSFSDNAESRLRFGDCRDERSNEKPAATSAARCDRSTESPISISDKQSDYVVTPTPENIERFESSDCSSLSAPTTVTPRKVTPSAELVMSSEKSSTPTPENVNKTVVEHDANPSAAGSVQTSEQPRSRHNSGDRVSRQVSKTSIPGRCRSVTPTELGRRRHVSTNSVESEVFDPFINMKEIQMPRFEGENEVRSFDTNFGHSLMAGYMDHYVADFVLHGTSETSFYARLLNDLSLNAQATVLDETVKEAVCIVANCDDWSVKLISSNGMNVEKVPGIRQTSSQLVGHLIESVNDMWKMKMTADFCLMHLEDRLQEIYFKSRMIAEYLRDQKKVDVDEMTKMLGFHSSDLQLLLAVAQTHSPELAFQLS